jgi:phage-related protein (TIGR01555 family)
MRSLKKVFQDWLREPTPEAPAPVKRRANIFSTDSYSRELDEAVARENAFHRIFQNIPKFKTANGVAMDDSGGGGISNVIGAPSKFNANSVLPSAQMYWYAAQSFIGYQLCAILAQHWLISKACFMPGKDAVRNGYEVTVNDGTDVDPKVFDAIRDYDKAFKLNANLREFAGLGRVFGIRLALFVVDSQDPHYYEKPFNVDGVTPGSYRGISQIDPYWVAPQLSERTTSKISAIDFYEPEWWLIEGLKIHKSHFVIFRTDEVADILKPTYLYGGVSVPQRIYERVYAAERTANEAPMLALSKRTDVINTAMEEVILNQDVFSQRMQQYTDNQNNFGVKILGTDETLARFDTTLADFDAVIMTQYQIVAAAANVPSVKLMGTSPKGFNTTGEFEEANYHEELESLQQNDLSPLIERHHALVIRSCIVKDFSIAPFSTVVKWNALDAMTAKEQMELNKSKAETAVAYASTGAIDAEDIRANLIADPQSGYSGISPEVPEPDLFNAPNDDQDSDSESEGVEE